MCKPSEASEDDTLDDPYRSQGTDLHTTAADNAVGMFNKGFPLFSD